MGVWKAYRSLNDEQKRIVREKRLDVNKPVDEILTLLKPVVAFDAAESNVGKWGCLASLAIVGAVLFAAFGGVVPRIIRLPIALALLVYGVLTLIFFFWAKRIDISDYLRGFVVPLLSLFREDIDRGQPVHLKMDLRAPAIDEKRQSVGKPYAVGAYHKIIDTVYLDPWLETDAVLADGSRLHWAITDTIVKHSKTKKTASGKYKTKTKYTRKSDIDVDLTLKKKMYSFASGVEDTKVKEGERSTTVKVSHTLKTKDLNPLPVRVMVDAMAGVYRSVQQPAAK